MSPLKNELLQDQVSIPAQSIFFEDYTYKFNFNLPCVASKLSLSVFLLIRVIFSASKLRAFRRYLRARGRAPGEAVEAKTFAILSYPFLFFALSRGMIGLG